MGRYTGPRLKKNEGIQTVVENGPRLNYPEWLEFDESNVSIQILGLPNANSVPFPIELSLVIEYYSRLL